MVGLVQEVDSRIQFPRIAAGSGSSGLMAGLGAPTDGTTSATGYGFAGKGYLYIDSNDGKLYSMTGTGPASLSWEVVGSQS